MFYFNEKFKKIRYFCRSIQKISCLLSSFSSFYRYEFRCDSSARLVLFLDVKKSEMRKHRRGWGRLVFSRGPVRASTDGQT